ncbi:MAG TPA: hypothetical protein VGZ93_12575 [Candidatus Methylacidiphilales bacterium]|jgi:hypothetical protein|nr:hypothetical protein [Candidatus Methylacidiphilales bacterium]
MEQMYSVAEEQPILCGEEARKVYRLAYYQRRVNQVFGMFIIFSLGVSLGEGFGLAKESLPISIIIFCVLLAFPYGAYCFLRLKAGIYTWWLAPFVCLFCLFPPFLFFELILSCFTLRKIYREHGIPTGLFGVSAQTLREIKDHF